MKDETALIALLLALLFVVAIDVVLNLRIRKTQKRVRFEQARLDNELRKNRLQLAMALRTMRGTQAKLSELQQLRTQK